MQHRLTAGLKLAVFTTLTMILATSAAAFQGKAQIADETTGTQASQSTETLQIASGCRSEWKSGDITDPEISCSAPR